MIALLEKLTESLESIFKEHLKSTELKFRKDQQIDVFKTYITLAKTANDFRKLIEKSALPLNELSNIYGDSLNEAIKSKLINKGATINDNKVFINTKGLYKFYMEKDLSVFDVFEGYDDFKFPEQNLVLKRQEKILSIFLLLMGADSEDNKLITKDKDKETLTRYHRFLITIDDMLKEKELSIGSEFNWNTGKRVAFRSFIQENNDLPKTGIYEFNTGDISYWLNLQQKRNISYFLDLILDEYIEPIDKYVAKGKLYEVLLELSYLMPELLLEVPKDLNSLIVKELRG